MCAQKLAPVHPGEVLLEEFLKPMNLSQNHLALSIGVPPRRINEIVLEKRGMTADTALRLARYFNMSPQFWMGIQMHWHSDGLCTGFSRGAAIGSVGARGSAAPGEGIATWIDRINTKKQDKCSLFRAKAMNPYLCRPRNITLTDQTPHFFRCCRTRLR